MKLQLQVNQNAIADTTRGLAASGVLLTPAIGESFWLYRVPVSDGQAVVGFPKFGVIGVGFQHEEDWNTNLPSGTDAVEIYEHIRHNKGDAKIPRERCVQAIRLIQTAVHKVHEQEAIERLQAATSDEERLKAISKYLRRSGGANVAQAYDQDPRFRW